MKRDTVREVDLTDRSEISETVNFRHGSKVSGGVQKRKYFGRRCGGGNR